MERFPRLCASALLVSISACGGPRSDRGYDPDAGLEPLDRDTAITTNLTAADGGVATSPDGRFAVTFPPASLTADARVTITAKVDEARPAEALSKAYAVSLAPDGVGLAFGELAQIEFLIDTEKAAAAGHDVMAVAVLDSGSFAFEQLLSATYDGETSKLRREVAYMAAFAAVDGDGERACGCDTGLGCDSNCGCDEGCGGTPDCAVGQKACDSGQCIAAGLLCDFATMDCIDGSDELGDDCGPPPCAGEQFRCLDGTCLTPDVRCDGTFDCPDRTDEGMMCFTSCSAGEWECFDGGCIAEASRCDRTTDCADGSDEGGACDYPLVADAFEPDDDFAAAKPIVSGVPQSRSLHVDGDQDFVKLTLATWARLTLATAGSSGDTIVRLYDADGDELAMDDDGGDGTFSLLQQEGLRPGDYFASVEEYGNTGTIADYTLTLTATEIPPYVAAPTDVSVTLDGTTVVVSWAAVADAVAYEVLYDTDTGAEPYAGTQASEGASPLTTTALTQRLSGMPNNTTVYVAVRARSAEAVSAPVTGQVRTPLAPDVYEEDDTFGTAKVIESGEPQAHNIDAPGEIDFVTFTLGASADVRLQTSGPSGDSVLVLYDATRTPIAEDDDGGASTWSLIHARGLAAGTYYASVVEYSQDGPIADYTLTLTVTQALPGPTGVTAVAGDGRATVSWGAVSGATSYKVYYDDEAANPPFGAEVAATQGASPVSASGTQQVLTGLVNGRTYYFAVSAVVGGVETALSAQVSARPSGVADSYESDDTIGTAKALAVGAAQTRSIHVGGDVDIASFTLAEAADIVLVVEGGAVDPVVSLLDASGTEIAGAGGGVSRLEVPMLAPGNYFAKVRAVSSTASLASYTLTLEVAPPPPAPTDVVATAGAGQVTLTWSAVSGATSYLVYYDNDTSNPSYSPTIFAAQGAPPLSTNSVSFTLTGLPAGTPFVFAVRAVNGAAAGPYSAEVTATPQ